MEKDILTWIQKGKAEFDRKNFVEAYGALSRAVGILEEGEEGLWLSRGEEAELYALRAESLLYQNERDTYQDPDVFNQVLDDLSHAIELAPDLVAFRLARAKLFLHCGFADATDNAEEDLLDVLKADSEHPEGLNLLGQMTYKRGNYHEAVPIFSKLLMQVALPEIYELRALSNFRKFPADYVAAIRDFQAALELAPERNEYLVWVAACYQELGNTDEAIAVYDRLLEQDPGNSGHWVDRGTLLFEKDPVEALKDFDQAIEIDGHPLAYNNRAFLYLQEGKYDDAIDSAKKALKQDPSLAIAYATLAETFALKGDIPSFYAHFERALKYYYQDPVEIWETEAFEALRQEEKFKSLVARRFSPENKEEDTEDKQENTA